MRTFVCECGKCGERAGAEEKSKEERENLVGIDSLNEIAKVPKSEKKKLRRWKGKVRHSMKKLVYLFNKEAVSPSNIKPLPASFERLWAERT